MNLREHRYTALKMSYNLFIIFTTCTLLLICEIHSAAVNSSIIETIKADSSVCPTRKVFIESDYAKSCNAIKFLANLPSLDDTNADMYLCLGMYDRISRICVLSSLASVSGNANELVPNDAKALDKEIGKSFPKVSSDVVESFCKNWAHYQSLGDAATLRAGNLETSLQKQELCIKICLRYDEVIKPLCLLLETMDGISTKLKLIGPNSTANAADKVIVGGQAQPESVKTKKVTEKSNIPSVKEAKVDKSEAKKGGANSNNGGTTAIETGSQPAGDSAVAEAQSDNIQKSSVAKSLQNQGNTAHTEINLEQSPQTAANQASAVHQIDNTDEKKKDDNVDEKKKDEKDDTETPDNDLLDSNTNTISEHTQDEEIPGDVDVGNEIESPMMTLSKEEVKQQNSAAPSENFSYGPRRHSDDDSHFFGYFTVIGVICIAGYIGYHNKQKILAMVLEGRRSRGGRNRRRPSTANYRKLDCTLEEAVTSQCNSNVTHVIY